MVQITFIEEDKHMLDHPTLDQLKTLKLDGMAEAFTERLIQYFMIDVSALRSSL